LPQLSGDHATQKSKTRLGEAGRYRPKPGKLIQVALMSFPKIRPSVKRKYSFPLIGELCAGFYGPF
jgi:hypothetical protein